MRVLPHEIVLRVVDYLLNTFLDLPQLLILKVHIVPFILRIIIVCADYVMAGLCSLLKVVVGLLVVVFKEVFKIKEDGGRSLVIK